MDSIIRSVDDLIQSILETDFNNGDFIFRGQVNSEWIIQPTLLRNERNHDLYILEKALFTPIFQKKKIPYLNTFEPVEYLSILQHFNIPTRLLDWTKNPYHALFFGCFDRDNQFKSKNGNFIITHKKDYKLLDINHRENPFFEKDFDNINQERFWDRLENNDIYYVEPFLQNPRMSNQNGCFLFFPFLLFTKDDTTYVDLKTYFGKRNNYRKENKMEGYIWLASKEIDYKEKKNILKELEYKYSISFESLFINSEYIKAIEIEFKSFYNEILVNFDRFKKAYENKKSRK